MNDWLVCGWRLSSRRLIGWLWHRRRGPWRRIDISVHFFVSATQMLYDIFVTEESPYPVLQLSSYPKFLSHSWTRLPLPRRRFLPNWWCKTVFLFPLEVDRRDTRETRWVAGTWARREQWQSSTGKRHFLSRKQKLQGHYLSRVKMICWFSCHHRGPRCDEEIAHRTGHWKERPSTSPCWSKKIRLTQTHEFSRNPRHEIRFPSCNSGF